ncbi:SLC13 family permease [Archaeoglobus sp.]
MLLLIFVTLTLILSILYPSEVVKYPNYVDWETILALAGLLMVTTGIRESGYLNFLSCKAITRVRNKRVLALVLVSLALLLSPLLTNDVTLFVTVPLTASLGEVLNDRDFALKLVVFETIAVNVGSTLTPIGNPQNLFIWHNWGVSFLTFVKFMLPLFALLTTVLFIFVVLSFKGLAEEPKCMLKSYDRTLLWISIILLAIYVIALELKVYRETFVVLILLLYAVLRRDVLKRVDWTLLILFILMFVDFRVLSQVKVISNAVKSLDLSSSRNVLIFSVITSQLMSNVPASIFVSKFTHDWLAICYGVNVGGNGFLLGSLANVIAMRLVKDKKFIKVFHKYSIPFMAVTAILSLFLV